LVEANVFQQNPKNPKEMKVDNVIVKFTSSVDGTVIQVGEGENDDPDNDDNPDKDDNPNEETREGENPVEENMAENTTRMPIAQAQVFPTTSTGRTSQID
jgi:hypothetical protein